MAQNHGVGEGVVIDTNRMAVGGATMTARNTKSGETFVTSTEHTGFYTFLVLTAGEYVVSAEKAGYEPGIAPGGPYQVVDGVATDFDEITLKPLGA
jgi:hypothetical protein